MRYITVARTVKFEEMKPIIVEVDGMQIGVVKNNGKYYAYENTCAHQGGPACEGEVIGRMECMVSENGSITSEFVSKNNLVIACPWHCVEYDLASGICTADTNLRLRKFDVVVENDEIKIGF
jgi:nitrite reductase/ring-hydroxylating ferredoxin subunit